MIPTSGLLNSELVGAFSNDNKLFASSSYKTLSIWNIDQGRKIQSVSYANFDRPNLIVNKISFSENGDEIIILTDYSNDTLIYNVITEELEVIIGPQIDITKLQYKPFVFNKAQEHYKVNPTENFKIVSNDSTREIVFTRELIKDQFFNYFAHPIVDDSIGENITKTLNPRAFFSADSRFAAIEHIIYDFENKEIKSKLKTIYSPGFGAAFDENNRPLFLSQNQLNILEFPKLKPIRLDDILDFELSENRKYLAYTSANFTTNESNFHLIDLDSKKQIGKTINNSTLSESILAVSSNGRFILVNSPDKYYKIYDTNSGDVVYNTNGGLYHRVQFLEDDWIFEFHENNKTFVKINLLTGETIPFELELLSEKVKDSEYNFSISNKNFLVFNTTDANFQSILKGIWNIQTGKLIHQYTQSTSLTPVQGDLLTQDGRFILFKSTGNIEMVDASNLETVNIFTGISGAVLSVDISPDQKLLIAGTTEGETKVWNISTGSEIGNLVCTRKKGLAFVAPDHYYYATKASKDYIHFSLGKEIYLFDQFDLKYNRPDILLKRYNPQNKQLIKAYYKAYQKRLKKMGFTEEMLKDDFHLPEIRIENYEEMPTIHEENNIDLNLHIEDSKYPLDRINVWINDVAILGTDGISLRELNTQLLDKKINIPLAKGKNKIQVSVLNQAGAESYKETLELECTIGKDQPDLYLITIGESEFQQADFNLTYAAKDAQDVAQLFANSKVYNEVFSKTLTNSEVTKEKILALKTFLNQADINDHVMIFLAGHGVLSADLDYYLATYDMDFNKPEDRGLMYDDLENLLDGIKPLSKTLIIDACHSGEIDKEEMELAVAENTEEGDVQFRAVNHTVKSKLGSQNTLELTKSLFTDLRKGTGATVISSAGGMEFAMESGDWQNGLFTYALLNGIKTGDADLNNDGEIWLSEIQEYVGQEVTRMSNGLQQPTSRIENQTVDFRIW